MTLPAPRPGLVIRYAYLWSHEAKAGREESTKDRPCAVLLTTFDRQGDIVVLALPITHSVPDDLSLAVEIPLSTKKRLGLDDARSWIIVSEANRFIWPGPDLRPVKANDIANVVYGLLPDKLYAAVRDKWLAAYDRQQMTQVARTS